MRLAFISLMYDAPWGGSEVLWTDTALRALAEGHEVLVCIYAWPELPAPLQALAEAGAQFFLRSRYENTMRYRALSWLARLPAGGTLPEIRALARFKPDAVLVSQGGWLDLYYHTQLRQLLRKVPFVLACHNYHDPTRQRDFSREAIKEIYDSAEEVIMISANQLRAIRRHLIDTIAKARVVQNPLNLPAERPVVRVPAADGVPRLAVIASFDVDRKGQDVLLEALACSEWECRPLVLNLYGKGPDKLYIEELIRFYGLSDRVHLRGHVTDPAAIWCENDILVIPSRIESGPMVLQEAMLCGVPVVAADVGMVRDWLDDEETGFIADTATVVSLNKALGRAWARQADWPAMGILASERAWPKLEKDPAGGLLKRMKGFVDNATNGKSVKGTLPQSR